MTDQLNLNDRTFEAVTDPGNVHPILVASFSDQESERLLHRLRSAGMSVYLMDGRLMQSEEGFFEQFSRDLGWDEMGRNWNAVLDQLRSLAFLPSDGGTLVAIQQAEQVLQAWPERIHLVIDVFEQAAKEIAAAVDSAEPTPFHLLLMSNDVALTVSRWGLSASVV